MHTLEGFKILVVEDDPDLNEIMCEFLISEHAIVFPAANGQHALSILETQEIDFVLSDIQMPIMDGIGMLVEISKSDIQKPPVLFVTGQSKFTEIEAKRIGAVGLINKPFSKETLIQTVSKISAEIIQGKVTSV